MAFLGSRLYFHLWNAFYASVRILKHDPFLGLGLILHVSGCYTDFHVVYMVLCQHTFGKVGWQVYTTSLWSPVCHTAF